MLAQIYENKARTEENDKEVKSRIKAHSDKTRDMPKEGLRKDKKTTDNVPHKYTGRYKA